MKNKLVIISTIIISIILIVLGFALHNSSNTTLPDKEKIQEKESKKEIVDGFKSDVEPTLRAQHIYNKTLRITDTLVKQSGPFYLVTFYAENIGQETLPYQHLDFTFLSNTKKVLGVVDCYISELKQNQKEYVTCQSTNEKIFEAFDYKVSPGSKKIEQE